MASKPQKYSKLSIEDRRRISERIWLLRKQGVPINDIRLAFRISGKTIERIMQAGGDHPPVKPTSDLPPDNPPPISIGYTTRKLGPLAMVIKRPWLYFNSCPRKCGGTVEVTDTAVCLSCGWEHYGQPRPELLGQTFRMVDNKRMAI